MNSGEDPRVLDFLERIGKAAERTRRPEDEVRRDAEARALTELVG